MELTTRPQFYLDIVEEVEYLARRAGPEGATRWHASLDQTIEQLLRILLSAGKEQTSSRQEFVPGA